MHCSIKAGCDAFVLKPELDELLARVSTTIAARGARAGKPGAVVARKVRG